jgi:hypothetical protein
VAARFSADGYREKQVVEQHVAPSGVDLRQLSPEERETLAALLTKAKIAPSHDRPDQPKPVDGKPGTADGSGSVH